MIFKWLAYIASLGVALFLSIMYYEPFPVLCLLLLFVIPIVGFIIQLPLAWLMQVKLVANSGVCEMGETNQVMVQIENPSWIPAFQICLHIWTKNKMSGQQQMHQLYVSVPANRKMEIPIGIESEYCGTFQVALQRVDVYGIIPIYRWRRRFRQENSKKIHITILPAIQQLSMQISQGTRMYCVDWDALKINQETNPIYKIRTFQEGDRLQTVHWKLSARMDQWMIRELPVPDGANVCVVMDWSGHSFSGLNRIMEASISLSLGIVMESCKILLASSLQPGEWFAMTKEEDLYVIFGQIMGLEYEGKKREERAVGELLSELEHQCVGITFAHMYYITDRSQEQMGFLLGSSHLARRKTFIHTGEKEQAAMQQIAEQYQMEYVFMGEHNQKRLEKWQWIV